MVTDHWKGTGTVEEARRTWFERPSISERQAGGVWLAGKTVLAAYDEQAAELALLRRQVEAVREVCRVAKAGGRRGQVYADTITETLDDAARPR